MLGPDPDANEPCGNAAEPRRSIEEPNDERRPHRRLAAEHAADDATLKEELQRLRHTCRQLTPALHVVEIAGTKLRVPRSDIRASGGPVMLGIRPERLVLLAPAADPGTRNALRGTVSRQSFAGNLLHVAVDLGGGVLALVETRPGEAGYRVGDAVQVAWEWEHALILTD